MNAEIATFRFVIDDNLLCRKTADYLHRYVLSSDTTTPHSGNHFRIFLQKDESFFNGFMPSSVKLGKTHTSETRHILRAADDFSCFCIDLEKQEMHIFPANDRYLDELDFITDLKLLLSIVVLDKGGVMMHASAVINNGRAYLFAGRSGSGKSTIARLLGPEYTVINDEFNVLIPQNGIFYVYSTPFGMIHTVLKAPVPVGSLFVIKKGVVNRIEPVLPEKRMLSIIGNIFTYPANDYYAHCLLDNVNFIKDTLGLRRLLFTNDGSFATFFSTIEHYLHGGETC